MGESYIETMTDQELEGLQVKGDPDRAAKAAAFGSGQSGNQESAAGSIPWKLISQTHPDYDAGYWQECRALYSGGKRLLRNLDLMERIFPAHNAEDKAIYAERVKRAHYFPYPGAIIDAIASGLSADPVVVLPSDPDDKDATLPDWWGEFFKDVSKKGSIERCSLAHFAVTMIREAMITEGVSWALVDLPQAPGDGDPNAPTDRLEQERAGLLDPYVTPIPAESVIEWKETDGELDWALICTESQDRPDLFTPRGNITKTFTIWTRDTWTKYQISYDPRKPPKPDDPVNKVAEGTHPFLRVPLLRVTLPEGLRAMDKLESMAREHLNKRNALSWAEYKSLFALLYEFLAPEEGGGTRPTSAAQQDPDRALSVRGQGYVNERGHEDRAEYVGPPTAPFSEARLSCDQIKSEMYRVMHAMADSIDQTSGSVRRSGESKAQDNKSKDVLLKELGRYARELVHAMMVLLQAVKGDEPHRVGGGDSFDSVDLMAKVTEAVELVNGLPMKSPTFLRVYLERIYTLVLKGELTDAEKEAIRSELATMITMEDLMMSSPMPPPPPPGDGGSDDGEDDGGDDGEDDDEEPPPPPGKKKPAVRRGVNYKS